MRSPGKAPPNRGLKPSFRRWCDHGSVVEFSVLGPLEAVVEGRSVPLPAAKPRALLALLLLNRNRVVPVGELIEELWSGEPPETAMKALQVYVSQLRKAIGADRVLTKPPGYSLRVDEGELDLDRFEQLVREGRERLGAGDAKEAAERLEQGLALWRGPALAEFGSEPFARDAGARLEESRLEAIEGRIEADLVLGRHAQLVSELEQLVARPAPKPAGSPEATPRRRPILVLLLVLVLAALAAGIAALALTRGGSSGKGDAEVRTFVSKVENFLVQSREGRREISAAIGAAFDCKLTPRVAAVRLNRVQRNRQSLLEQIAALSVPNKEEAFRASELLQKAAHASITADWHYRDWLLGRKRCGPPDGSADLRAAAAADAEATRTKRAFVAVFDPLARRFHQRVWTAGDF